MRALVSVLVLAMAGASATVVACADSSDPSSFEGGDTDAAVEPVAEGGLLADAGVEADAPVDAAPRVCSDQGFCPTAVPATETLRGVWGDGTGVVWSVSAQGDILRWDGAAWKVHASGFGPLTVIWGASPTDVWVGGEQGIFHGTGAASASLVFTGNPAPGGVPVQITSIWGTSATDVWITGVTPDYPPEGRVMRFAGASTDAGPTWTVDAVTAQSLAFTKVWGTATSGVWLAGSRPVPDFDYFEETLVLRKPIGATKFTEVVLPQDPLAEPDAPRLAVLVDAAPSGDSSMWLVGRDRSGFAHLLKGTSANGGQTFAFTLDVSITNKDAPNNAVWGVAANDTWLAGEAGRLRHWDGTTWTQAAITVTKFPVGNALYSVWSKGSQDLWVVGDGIALHRKQ